jgi:hypothetical protein
MRPGRLVVRLTLLVRYRIQMGPRGKSYPRVLLHERHPNAFCVVALFVQKFTMDCTTGTRPTRPLTLQSVSSAIWTTPYVNRHGLSIRSE